MKERAWDSELASAASLAEFAAMVGDPFVTASNKHIEKTSTLLNALNKSKILALDLGIEVDGYKGWLLDMLDVSEVLSMTSYCVPEAICLEKCEAARMNILIQVNRTRFIMDRIEDAICSSVASQVQNC